MELKQMILKEKICWGNKKNSLNHVHSNNLIRKPNCYGGTCLLSLDNRIRVRS